MISDILSGIPLNLYSRIYLKVSKKESMERDMILIITPHTKTNLSYI